MASKVVMNTPQSQAIVDVLTKFGFVYRSGFSDEIDTVEKFSTRVYLARKIFKVMYNFELKFFSLEEIKINHGDKEDGYKPVLLFMVGGDSPDDLNLIIGARYDTLENVYADLSAKLNPLGLV